jgi:hypothetical protein
MRLSSVFALVTLVLLALFAQANAGMGNGADESLSLYAPIHTAAQLQSVAPGALVAVEGRISASAPTNDRGLALYLRREGSPLYGVFWKTLEHSTPPFTLDTPDGQLRIANGDYSLENGRTVEPDNYYGFTPGDEVTVFGQMVRGEDAPALKAAKLVGGTWTDYTWRLRWSRWGIAALLALGFGLANLVVVLVSLRPGLGFARRG